MPYRIILLLTLFCSSCRQHTALTEHERSVIIEEVNAMLKNYYDDVSKDGLRAEFNYLDSSDQFFWVPPGFNSAIPYDSVANILRRNAPMLKSVNNILATSQVIPLTSQLANYTITLRSIVTDITGNVSEYSLVESGTVVKRVGGWKLLSGQTTLVENSKKD